MMKRSSGNVGDNFVLQTAKDRRSSSLPRMRTWLAKAGAGALAFALVGSLSWVTSDAAYAETVYEIEGEWQENTPTVVETGDTLATVWRFNINDDSPVPGNEPIENVTPVFTAQNARFTSLPGVCLTAGVDPVSTISADGFTLTCNLGTRDEGTAELMLTGLVVTGKSGDLVSVTGSISGVAASVPEIPILSQFAMDMKFDGGNPTSANTGTTQSLSFPYSLRHSVGSAAGPSSVSYDLTFTPSVTGHTPLLANSTCGPQNRSNAGHPFSGAGHDAARTAPNTACTITQIGTNRFRLTVSGIDYSKAQVPTLDSAGNLLPISWDVVAAGLLNLQFTWATPVSFEFTATAPTYTSIIGEESVDDSTNNSNAVASTRGSWTGGWQLNRLAEPMPGAIWEDTFRTMAGQPALSVSGVRSPEPGSSQNTQVCTVIDRKYVDFEDAVLGVVSAGEITPYDGIVYWYYTGTGVNNNVNPGHANYNPNTFTCEGTTGWTTTKPANLDTVKAVKAIISPAAGANIPTPLASLYVKSTVKDNVAIGQDIWTWTSFSFTGDTAWQNLHRSGTMPASGTPTPGARYAFAAGGRDVMRIIGAIPKINKEVDQKESIPGAVINYTLTYRAQAPVSATVPIMTIEDELPAGLEYVAGSGSPAPTSQNGQTLTWAIENAETNTDYVITLSARVTESAVVGQSFRNTATAAISQQESSAAAATEIRDGGQTMLTKTAAAAKVPHVFGVAEDSWTVRISSQDTNVQQWTDTVDILPFMGDGRGSAFTGSYKLSQPIEAVAGATVYYTTADPAALIDDPAHPSNGSAGDITGNTVGWTTTYTENATAVRVKGPKLGPSQAQEFVISVITEGASPEDTYVNRAEARSDRTQLVMRTSSRFEIGAVNSVALKKYVQDSAGDWRDANDVDDYPEFHTGTTVTYRLVVTNTGDETLHNLAITDDKVDLAALDPLPAGLVVGAIIPELLPGESNAVVIEYEVALVAQLDGDFLVNTACVAPQEGPAPDPDEDYVPPAVEESCDPAGLKVLPSSLSWEKVASGTTVNLEGSEWELMAVDDTDQPIGAAIIVTDCVAGEAADCFGADVNPAAGAFTIDPVADGRYRLVETQAPAGYKLDQTPRFIDVLGATSFEQAIENELVDVPTLPLTGGVGSLNFWVGSGGLGILALGGFLWQRRRMGTLQKISAVQ